MTLRLYTLRSLSPEIGDLLFYNSGYVFLYLGNHVIIGMTPSGIVIREQIQLDEPNLLGYGHVQY